MKKCIFVIFILINTSSPGNAIEPGAEPRRIVSLAPSMTEVLFGLGLGERIVGVTSFCDHPDEAKKKPKIGGMSNPSLEAVVSLRPDLVVMTTDGNPKAVEIRLRALGIRTYVWTARTIAELAQGIRELGAAIGVSGKADLLAEDIEKALRKEVQSSEFTTQINGRRCSLSGLNRLSSPGRAQQLTMP